MHRADRDAFRDGFVEPPDLRSAHVIVVGNEKGGTGKSTLSIHLSVALMKAGFRVATIDLDTRQQTLTRFFENRTSWAQSAPWDVELPYHFALERGNSDNVRDNETTEFAAFAEAISAVEHTYEFVVIDTPASDSYLMRLAHSLADTLVSPVNDSYIDVDVFSRVHHDRDKRGAVAHYADLVLEARRKRQLVDQGIIDWVLVRNRVASLQSNNAKQIAVSIGRMAGELKFRAAEGMPPDVLEVRTRVRTCRTPDAVQGFPELVVFAHLHAAVVDKYEMELAIIAGTE